MSYLDDISFQYYNGKIYEPTPLGNVTLRQFIQANRDPQNNIKEVFNKIAEASKRGDNKLKSDLKQNNLFYFTPAIQVKGGRKYEMIEKFNGIAILDFDNLPVDHAKEFKRWVFDNLKSCICCYLSPSRKGIKALVRIPVVLDVDSYKSYVYGLGYYFEKYLGWDGSVQSPVLPVFLSWDSEILVREDATIWDKRGEKMNSFVVYEGEVVPLEEVCEEDKLQVENIFRRGISNIIENAHPTSRNYCLMLGGYCIAGYLTIEEAEDLVKECISDNEYMSKNTHSYIKTGLEFLRKGLNSPLYLDKDEK